MNTSELFLICLFFLVGQVGGYCTVNFFNGSFGLSFMVGIVYSALLFTVSNKLWPLFELRCPACGKPLSQFDTTEKNGERTWICPCGEEYNLKDGKLFYLNQQL